MWKLKMKDAGYNQLTFTFKSIEDAIKFIDSLIEQPNFHEYKFEINYKEEGVVNESKD